MKRQKNYSDGTPITAPFYVCQCQNGHKYWSVVKSETCYYCGVALTQAPADKKRAANCN